MYYYKNIGLEVALVVISSVLIGAASHRLMYYNAWSIDPEMLAEQNIDATSLSGEMRELIERAYKGEKKETVVHDMQKLQGRINAVLTAPLTIAEERSELALPVGIGVGVAYCVMMMIVILVRAANAPRPGLLIDPDAIGKQSIFDEDRFSISGGRLILAGQIDPDLADDVQDLQVALHQLLGSEENDIYVDFSSQQEVSSRHIALLIDFAMRAQEKGKTLRIRASEHGIRVFNMVGLGNLAEIEQDET